MAVFRDTSRVLAGYQDSTARILDVATGQVSILLTGHTGSITAVAFSQDGSRALTGSLDSTARLWNSYTGELLRAFPGHAGAVRGVDFSPDGTTILTGSDDSTAIMWDAATGAVVHRFKGHTGGIRAAVFSPEGSTVLTGSLDSTAILWNAGNGFLVRTLRPLKPVLSATFAPDGQTVFLGLADGTAEAWIPGTGERIRIFPQPAFSPMPPVFSPNGQKVLTYAKDGSSQIWNASTGGMYSSSGPLLKFGNPLGDLSISPDGSRFLGYSYYEFIHYDAATLETIRRIPKRGIESPDGAVFSHDGKKFITTGTVGMTDNWERGAIYLWDAVTYDTIRHYTPPDWAMNAAFAPDGKTFAIACYNRTVIIFDIAGGQVVRTFSGHSGTVRRVEYSSDGERLLTAGDSTVRVWDVATGQLIQTFSRQPDGFTSDRFSPDGKSVLLAGDSTAQLRDAVTGTEIRTFVSHTGRVSTAVFSPDGLKVLTGSDDGTAKVWEATTGIELLSVGKMHGGVVNAGFFPDGSRFFTNDHYALMYWAAPTNVPASLGPSSARRVSDPVLKAYLNPRHTLVLTGAAIPFLRNSSLSVRSLLGKRMGAEIQAKALGTASLEFLLPSALPLGTYLFHIGSGNTAQIGKFALTFAE